MDKERRITEGVGAQQQHIARKASRGVNLGEGTDGINLDRYRYYRIPIRRHSTR